MGYLLKEALKTLCGVNQWCYAIFWKIGYQNPRLLIWEECYYEPIIYSNAMHAVQAGNKVHSLVTKMMKDNYINLLGEGLVGRVSFTGNHQWIISDNTSLSAHPPEVSNEVCVQFSAGMQTIAVIPINPHGVVQLGSSLTIMENLGFVNDVKSLIFQLGCIPGALLSENYMKNEGTSDTSPNHGDPICFGNSVSAGRSKVKDCTLFTSESSNHHSQSRQASGNSVCTSYSLSRHIGDSRQASGSTLPSPIVCQSSVKSDESHRQAKAIPLMKQNAPSRGKQQIGFTGAEVIPQNSDAWSKLGADLYNQDSKYDRQTAFGSLAANYDPLRSMERQNLLDAFSEAHVDEHCRQPKLTSGKGKLEHELFQALTMSSEDACFKPLSGDDLFDIVGMDFKNKLYDGSRNNLVNNGAEANSLNLVRNSSACLELQGARSDLFSICEGESNSGIYSLTASDHLLDAVVSKVHSSSKQISDNNASCRTSLTKTSSSSAPVASSSSAGANNPMRELIGVPKSLKKTGGMTCYSYKPGISKEDGGNFSETSSIISSQISSWVDQKHEVRKNGGVSSEYSKKADEISKSNRKRLKPGENPRPRPKDRQMIQDRVKELREIVPHGAKCSIDALLERTIKHMLFLQSVTKHADKLKQTGESKIVSKEGGLLLRDNFEGGATWAYEVGSQSMVCPIIVEDLNSPRQMLVEMLCEESGLFLEIADIIKGLGLTILKGVMESRNEKTWAHFTVEANRDVTRMEIFLSLVSLLEQAVKNNAASADCTGNEIVPTFHQAASNPSTGRACSLQ